MTHPQTRRAPASNEPNLESLGGKRIGPRDSLESVPGDSFQLAKASVEHCSTNDYYGRWARWLLLDRFERPVKPFKP